MVKINHPDIECPVCKMTKSFVKESRKVVVFSTVKGKPNTNVEMVLCKNCGYVLLFSDTYVEIK